MVGPAVCVRTTLTAGQGAVRVCRAGACEGICEGGARADVDWRAGNFGDPGDGGVGEQGTSPWFSQSSCPRRSFFL